MKLEEATIFDLIKELSKRKISPGSGLLQSEANKEVISKLEKENNLPVGLILTLGYPIEIQSKTHKCSRCHKLKDHTQFRYYHSRVDSDGYLMRANALCVDCAKSSNAKRKQMLDEADKIGLIPEKPNKGDVCSRCKREWFGNWHRDHDDIDGTFRGWICGNCNMSLGDQRNVGIKR